MYLSELNYLDIFMFIVELLCVNIKNIPIEKRKDENQVLSWKQF